MTRLKKVFRQSPQAILIANFVSSVCVAAWMNVFSKNLANQTLSVTEKFLEMGWVNIALVVWLLVFVWIIRSEKIERESSLVILARQLREQLDLFCEGCRFRKANEKGLNVHLFFHDFVSSTCDNQSKNIEVLRKNRSYYFQTENLPDNEHLDYADLTEQLEICQAFKNSTTCYRVFEDHKAEDYPERLRGKIDTRIKWVLAIPIRLPDDAPIGVLCCFGQELFFKNLDERLAFQVLALRLAGSVATMVDEDKTLKFYKAEWANV